jgi:hypothetical protein
MIKTRQAVQSDVASIRIAASVDRVMFPFHEALDKRVMAGISCCRENYSPFTPKVFIAPNFLMTGSGIARAFEPAR